MIYHDISTVSHFATSSNLTNWDTTQGFKASESWIPGKKICEIAGVPCFAAALLEIPVKQGCTQGDWKGHKFGKVPSRSPRILLSGKLSWLTSYLKKIENQLVRPQKGVPIAEVFAVAHK
jgi:hypothetical protein